MKGWGLSKEQGATSKKLSVREINRTCPKPREEDVAAHCPSDIKTRENNAEKTLNEVQQREK